MKRNSLLYCFFMLSLFVTDLKASTEEQISSREDAPIRKKPETPNVVLFGVYPLHLYGLDMDNGTFSITLYASWSTKDKDYRPEKSVEISNAVNFTSHLGIFGKNKDEYFTLVHYYAVVQHNWNTKYYPFDRQFFKVDLEDFGDISYVVFQPDYPQSKIHPELFLKGWKIIGMKVKKSTTQYLTNFGDSSIDHAQHDRLSLAIEVKREGLRTYIESFIGFFVAFFLCNVIFMIDHKNLGARSSLILGAIFAAVGNKNVLDRTLPPSSDFSLSDTFQLMTFFLIMVTVMSVVILELFQERWGARKTSIVNAVCGTVSFTTYVTVVVIHTVMAIRS